MPSYQAIRQSPSAAFNPNQNQLIGFCTWHTLCTPLLQCDTSKLCNSESINEPPLYNVYLHSKNSLYISLNSKANVIWKDIFLQGNQTIVLYYPEQYQLAFTIKDVSLSIPNNFTLLGHGCDQPEEINNISIFLVAYFSSFPVSVFHKRLHQVQM